jgi:hypothetical protein
VVQKALENLDEEMKRPLLDELHDIAHLLIEDSFGSKSFISLKVRVHTADLRGYRLRSPKYPDSRSRA